MALPKKNRLSLQASKNLFENCKRYYSAHFSIVVANQSTSTNSQFAIVVSKKVARKAHDRHKIRRLTSATIFSQLNKFPPRNYLVFPKNTILNTSFSEIISDISNILHKLNK